MERGLGRPWSIESGSALVEVVGQEGDQAHQAVDGGDDLDHRLPPAVVCAQSSTQPRI